MFSRLLNSHHHPITYSFIMSELSFSVGVIWKDSEYNVPQQASLEENLSLYPRNGMVWTVASKRKCFPWRNKAKLELGEPQRNCKLTSHCLCLDLELKFSLVAQILTTDCEWYQLQREEA